MYKMKTNKNNSHSERGRMVDVYLLVLSNYEKQLGRHWDVPLLEMGELFSLYHDPTL
jgi:hypothetical protein